MFHVPEQYRVRRGTYASERNAGNNGAFFVPNKPPHRMPPLRIIASDGMGWEHVSVSLPERCPDWDEMCLVKSIFWDAEDRVMQLHPPASEYVNCHPLTLHLWRPIGIEIPHPLPLLVGPS